MHRHPTRDGTAIRDYVHVTDLADAHVKALKFLASGGENGAFNLGTGQGDSVREVISTVGRLTGTRVRAQPAPKRPGDPPVLVAEAHRATSLLGCRPRLSALDTIIETAWRWQDARYSERTAPWRHEGTVTPLSSDEFQKQDVSR